MSKVRRRKRQFPMVLDILPGLKWSGKVTVNPCRSSPDFVVAFDAEDAKADRTERYVYDITTMSNDQLRAWTGVDVASLGET